MKDKTLTDFYNAQERLSYHPQEIFSLKRNGFKKLVAFDDRFQEVTTGLANLISDCRQDKIKVLDIGVGDAVYESLLSKKLASRCQFYGIDISKKQIARAKKYLFEGRVVDINSQSIPYRNNFFDIIIISEILEHLFSPDDLLKDAGRTLKPGGYILLTFPNSGALQIRLALLFTGRSDMLNYPQNKQHIRFFTAGDIISMLSKDYKVIKHQGVSSFLFDTWNFPVKIPMPRLLEVLGNKYLKTLALGSLLIVQKMKKF